MAEGVGEVQRKLGQAQGGTNWLVATGGGGGFPATYK